MRLVSGIRRGEQGPSDRVTEEVKGAEEAEQ